MGGQSAANQQPCRTEKSALQKRRWRCTQQHIGATKRLRDKRKQVPSAHTYTHYYTLCLVFSPTCVGFSSSKSTFKASGKTFCVAADEYRSNLEGCKWLHCEALKGSEEGAGEGDGDECRARGAGGAERERVAQANDSGALMIRRV